MSVHFDWREQAAFYGIGQAKGDPVTAVKCAELKYRALTGRELGLNEIHMLNDLVVRLIEEEKLKTLSDEKVKYEQVSGR